MPLLRTHGSPEQWDQRSAMTLVGVQNVAFPIQRQTEVRWFHRWSHRGSFQFTSCSSTCQTHACRIALAVAWSPLSCRSRSPCGRIQRFFAEKILRNHTRPQTNNYDKTFRGEGERKPETKMNTVPWRQFFVPGCRKKRVQSPKLSENCCAKISWLSENCSPFCGKNEKHLQKGYARCTRSRRLERFDCFRAKTYTCILIMLQRVNGLIRIASLHIQNRTVSFGTVFSVGSWFSAFISSLFFLAFSDFLFFCFSCIFAFLLLLLLCFHCFSAFPASLLFAFPVS